MWGVLLVLLFTVTSSMATMNTSWERATWPHTDTYIWPGLSRRPRAEPNIYKGKTTDYMSFPCIYCVTKIVNNSEKILLSSHNIMWEPKQVTSNILGMTRKFQINNDLIGACCNVTFIFENKSP